MAAPDRPTIQVSALGSISPRGDTQPRVVVPAASTPSPKPARPEPRKPEPELPPSMTDMGSWKDLPLPGPASGDDDLDDLETDTQDPLSRFRPDAPWWSKAVEQIRGDAYVMFMAGAAVLIFILVVALLLLKG